MGFFDIGMGEILLIIIVALIIWGPGKIPEIARTLGKAMSTWRKISSDLTTQIRKELEGEEDPPSQSMFSHSDKTRESPDGDMSEDGGEEKASPKDQ